MMRRSQSVRNRTAHSVSVSDDLGVLKEGAEQSIEDVLRNELAAARRDNDRLQSQVDSLNAALRARPPIEKVQELEKEFSSLELLLHGTQRENERAMAELDRAKNREKLLEKELKKLAGEDWEETLNLGGTLSNVPLVRPLGSNLARAAAADSSFVSTASYTTEQPPPSALSTEATLAHMEQIRTMLLGMTERLQSGEERLQQAVARAEKEKQQLDEMIKSEASIAA